MEYKDHNLHEIARELKKKERGGGGNADVAKDKRQEMIHIECI